MNLFCILFEIETNLFSLGKKMNKNLNVTLSGLVHFQVWAIVTSSKKFIMCYKQIINDSYFIIKSNSLIYTVKKLSHNDINCVKGYLSVRVLSHTNTYNTLILKDLINPKHYTLLVLGKELVVSLRGKGTIG